MPRRQDLRQHLRRPCARGARSRTQGAATCRGRSPTRKKVHVCMIVRKACNVTCSDGRVRQCVVSFRGPMHELAPWMCLGNWHGSRAVGMRYCVEECDGGSVCVGLAGARELDLQDVGRSGI